MESIQQGEKYSLYNGIFKNDMKNFLQEKQL